MTTKISTEEEVLKDICLFLQAEYPEVIFRVDYSAGMKMSIGSAKKLSALHGDKSRGYPDLFIAEPRGRFAGLYLEVKRSRNDLFKTNGGFRDTKHLQEQLEVLLFLRNKGYYAQFATGFDNAKEQINHYLGFGFPFERNSNL
jgi:hypothetical protein